MANGTHYVICTEDKYGNRITLVTAGSEKRAMRELRKIPEYSKSKVFWQKPIPAFYSLIDIHIGMVER